MKNLKISLAIVSLISLMSGGQSMAHAINIAKIERIGQLLEKSAQEGVLAYDLNRLGKTLNAFEMQAVLRRTNSQGKTCADIAHEKSTSTRFCFLTGSCDEHYLLFQDMRRAEEVAHDFIKAGNGDLPLGNMSPKEVAALLEESDSTSLIEMVNNRLKR